MDNTRIVKITNQSGDRLIVGIVKGECPLDDVVSVKEFPRRGDEVFVRGAWRTEKDAVAFALGDERERR